MARIDNVLGATAYTGFALVPPIMPRTVPAGKVAGLTDTLKLNEFLPVRSVAVMIVSPYSAVVFIVALPPTELVP